MSIHGNQYLSKFFMRENSNQPPVTLASNDELTLAFYLLTKDLADGEKIISFSRLIWPLLSIQGVISTHIILDGLNLFSKKGKYTNPPRKPLIGHILRNIDQRKKTEILERIIEVLIYEDTEAEKLSAGEESEYKKLHISNIVNPEFLRGLMGLIPNIELQPIKDFAQLDTDLTTERALDISEKFRNTIQEMKNNALRWDNLIEIISDKVDKWLIDLNVEVKDIETRFSSKINKTSVRIDDEQVREQMERERDNIDQWKVNQKKNIIEKTSLLFKNLDRNLEEILKKNRFYTNETNLKSKIFENLVPNFESHIEYLKMKGEEFTDFAKHIEQKFSSYKEKAKEIDIKAQHRLEEKRQSLSSELETRNQKIQKIKEKKNQAIKDIQKRKAKIEHLYNKVKTIIRKKKEDCLQEAEELKKWAMEDTEAALFSKPIRWFFLPIYVLFVEDENMFEERMEILFPGYISNSEPIYKDLSDAFLQFRNLINDEVEDNMKLRSNFEFTAEGKNFAENPNLSKMIQKGLSILRRKNMTNSEIETTVRENLKRIA
ncbi:MAG: hypothetical protein ACOC44_06250 [Promethearchaeia archaeon]